MYISRNFTHLGRKPLWSAVKTTVLESSRPFCFQQSKKCKNSRFQSNVVVLAENIPHVKICENLIFVCNFRVKSGQNGGVSKGFPGHAVGAQVGPAPGHLHPLSIHLQQVTSWIRSRFLQLFTDNSSVRSYFYHKVRIPSNVTNRNQWSSWRY
jgi:hypothetical protein